MYLDKYIVFFFKQKTAYEMRISDWSSDVYSSDLPRGRGRIRQCPRPCRQYSAWRRPRIRDRARAARARPYSPLHAPDRNVRAHIGAHVSARYGSRAVRDAPGAAGRDAREDRRRTYPDRTDAAPDFADRKGTRLNSSP